MTLRGNYHVLFGSQLITGLVTYPLSMKFGIPGLLLGFIPFLIGLIVVHIKHETDEREISLVHQINSYEGIGSGVIAALIYFSFPHLNWFYALLSGISIVRGIIGLIMFTVK